MSFGHEGHFMIFFCARNVRQPSKFLCLIQGLPAKAPNKQDLQKLCAQGVVRGRTITFRHIRHLNSALVLHTHYPKLSLSYIYMDFYNLIMVKLKQWRNIPFKSLALIEDACVLHFLAFLRSSRFWLFSFSLLTGGAFIHIHLSFSSWMRNINLSARIPQNLGK